MQIIKSPSQLKAIVNQLKKKPLKIGFVPTMGALHEGHLSLIRQARKECDIVVISIFINPMQFNENEDYKKYPCNLSLDTKMLKDNKVDYLFCPTAKSLFSDGFTFSVDPGELAKLWCGNFRPGHFAGVATIVLKLFNLVQPDTAYFGLKDFQQFLVVQRMVKDFNLPIQIKGLPTVREKDGLAKSSRNIYLTKDERLKAPFLYQALCLVKARIEKGEKKTGKLKKEALSFLQRAGFKVQYFGIADAHNLREQKMVQLPCVVLCGAFLGKTRLIDNLIRVADPLGSQFNRG